MKKLGLAMLGLLLCASITLGQERKSPRDLMIIGRDFNLFESVSVKPVSIGVTSWTDREHGTDPAMYVSGAMLSYKDIIRFECGGTATLHNGERWVDIAMITGISTLIADKVVVGAWFAPFWNTYGPRPDDPWGIMIGYAFSL